MIYWDKYILIQKWEEKILYKNYTNKTNEYVPKERKKKINITLDADILEKVRKLAENDDRSFSQYINRLLRNHIATKGG